MQSEVDPVEVASFWRAEPANTEAVPVAKPRLAMSEHITPYLRRIDETRWYSNGGPLVQEFEERLARHCGGNEAHAATVANATIGLALGLLASNPAPGTFCMVPSWTFAATGHAILLAGLVPWIVDVSAEKWALDAVAAREILRNAPGPVAAVIPVSPFGAPIDLDLWREFQVNTGIAVIIDAAAAFDSVRATDLPTVVSLHATKVCGVGEGGFIVSTDGNFVEEVQKRANFGFWNSREATVRSLNGKISEYAAAVGLAGLDHWPEARADFLRVLRTYRRNLDGQEAISLQKGIGESWVGSTVVVESRASNADTLARTLGERGIASRRWWGGGLHRHRAFREFPHEQMDQTEALADRTIGLPCWRDLPNDEIARICELVVSTSA